MDESIIDDFRPDVDSVQVTVCGKSDKPDTIKDGEKAKDMKKKGKGRAIVHSNEDDSTDEASKLVMPAENHTSDYEDGQLPLHESIKKTSKKKNHEKMKFAPPDETALQRDQRTIFVGNLPILITQKKPLLKQLHRLILSQLPSAKIESTRFRSIPFQAPTSSKLDQDPDNPLIPKGEHSESTSKRQTRAHDLERTSAWRSRQEDDPDKTDEKKYLTLSQKKKIAFIRREFHSTADTVNAYIVFAHPLPPEGRHDNLPPPAPTMNPYEAAHLAAVKCNGSLFMDRVLRFDLVRRRDDACTGLMETDPKLSVFVGNLDFTSKEEDLRAFFDKVISEERGLPTQQEDEEVDVNVKKAVSWVSRVRIVRDKETQLGKGFAYVQFVDHGCIDEIFATEEGKLKFSKRKLRIQRCKTLPVSSMSTKRISSVAVKSASTSGRPALTAPRIAVPKGDPNLGERIAHLTKEARKQAKSADTDRVARRLAKKKARLTLASTAGVKILGKGKERERVRKTRKTKPFQTAVAGAKKKTATKRVRSEKSWAKKKGENAG